MAKSVEKTDSRQSAELVRPVLDDDALRGITSFDEAFRLAQETYGDVTSAEDLLGTGFEVLNKDDKARLLNTPLVILQARLHDGENGEFASAIVVTEKGGRYIINDGSTGIYEQIKSLMEKTARDGGWIVRHGLRESEYPTCVDCSRPRPTKAAKCGNCGSSSSERNRGRTFYLDV